jgi:hypothetical protein
MLTVCPPAEKSTRPELPMLTTPLRPPSDQTTKYVPRAAATALDV